MFDFRLATVFCLGYRLSKHKMTRYFKNLGVHDPVGPLATPMLQYTVQLQTFCLSPDLIDFDRK